MGYLVTGIFASAAVTLILKLAGSGQNNRYAVLLGNYLTCIITAILQMKGSVPLADHVTVLCGLAAGVLFVLGLVLMQGSIAENGASLTGAFAKLGMLVPLALSFLFFHESPGVMGSIGILLAVSAIVVIHRSDNRKAGKIHTPLLLGTLLGCGFADAMAKIFEVYGKPVQEPLYFLILFFTAACITALLCIGEYRKTRQGIRLRDMVFGVLVGIPNYFSASLLVAALRTLPAVIVYPSYSVGSLLLILAGGVLLFREPVGRKELAGIALIAASLIFLNV